MELKQSKYTHCWENNHTTSNKQIKGEFMSICPHCKTVNSINIDLSANISSKTFVSFNPSFSIECANCGSVITINNIGIGPNIINAITRLNNAGYEVDYSCEGYVNSYKNDDTIESSLPYISFKDNSIKKHGVPDGWEYIDGGDICKSNSCWLAMRYIPYCSFSNIQKKKALASLYTWLDEFC